MNLDWSRVWAMGMIGLGLGTMSSQGFWVTVFCVALVSVGLILVTRKDEN